MPKSHKKSLKPRTACGIVCFRNSPHKQFLLLERPVFLDFPKGHVDKGEDHRTTALRELEEEAGIHADDVVIDEAFYFETARHIRPPYLDGKEMKKTYVFFLAQVPDDVTVTISDEHIGYQWMDWSPPHAINDFMIDPVLQAIAEYWEV